MAGEYSVIIPTHNRQYTLLKTLASINAQDVPELLHEVIVVDDGSKDDISAQLAELEMVCPMRLVRREQSGGPGAARNTGIKAATGEFLLFLDDDIEATPGLVRAHHEQRRHAAANVCVLGRIDWPPEWHVTVFMRLVAEHYQFGHEELVDGRELPEKYFVFANLSAPKTFFDECGGFSEELRFFEDLDLGIRFVEAGARLYFAADALGYHHRPPTVTGYCRRQEMIGPSALLFARKYPNRPEVTRLDRAPQWDTLRGVVKNTLFNRVTVPGWKMLAAISGIIGPTRLAEALYFQILSYYYYRGIARALALEFSGKREKY